MTFIIFNPSEYDIQNVTITSGDGLLSESIGRLAAGETETLVRPHAVTEAELSDGEVRYTLSHDGIRPGTEKSVYPLSAPVVRGEARPDIDFTRQLSTQYIVPGGQLTVTYRVTNNGNIPAESIGVRDTLGDFSARLETLEVGASRTFISRIAIEEESESLATLEYAIPGGELFSRTLDAIPIHLSDSALQAEFSVGRSAFGADTADAILTLTNTGSGEYSGISVIDDVYGGIIADSVTLSGDDNPFEIAYTYPVRGSGEYRWRIRGVTRAGDRVDMLTDTVYLTEEPEPEDIRLSVRASCGTAVINRAGNVVFDLEIANQGNTPAVNLRLYEVSRGDVRTLAILPTGQPTLCRIPYEVTEDSEFIFCINYTDADGRPRTISATPIAIKIAPDGVDPDFPEADAPGPNGQSVRFNTTSAFTVLLIVASAALVALFTLLLIIRVRERRQRRIRAVTQRRRPPSPSAPGGKGTSGKKAAKNR